MSSKFFDSMLGTRYGLDCVTPAFSKEAVVVRVVVAVRGGRARSGRPVKIPRVLSLYLFDIRFSDLPGLHKSTNGTAPGRLAPTPRDTIK